MPDLHEIHMYVTTTSEKWGHQGKCVWNHLERKVGNDILIILWSQKIKLNEKEIEFIFEE